MPLTKLVGVPDHAIRSASIVRIEMRPVVTNEDDDVLVVVNHGRDAKHRGGGATLRVLRGERPQKVHLGGPRLSPIAAAIERLQAREL